MDLSVISRNCQIFPTYCDLFPSPTLDSHFGESEGVHVVRAPRHIGALSPIHSASQCEINVSPAAIYCLRVKTTVESLGDKSLAPSLGNLPGSTETEAHPESISRTRATILFTLTSRR